MEPMDHLFSSPEKSTRKTNGVNGRVNSTLSSDEMDIADSRSFQGEYTGSQYLILETVGTVPEPMAVLSARNVMRMPLPKSKSPRKTFLNSPARRHTSLGPRSSPARGAAVTGKTPQMTARVLKFGKESPDGNNDSAYSNRSPPGIAGGLIDKNFEKLTSAPLIHLHYSSYAEDNNEDLDQNPILDDGEMDDSEDSMQMLEGGEDDSDIGDQAPDDEPAGQSEEESEREEIQVASIKKKGGKRKQPHTNQEVEEKRPKKKTRRSLSELPSDGESMAQPTKKRGRPSKANASAKAAANPKSTTKKQKPPPISQAESPEVQRGPPLPRNNRGLIILRRETPNDATGFQTTRSGRNSIKPVAYWKNERIEFYGDEAADGAHGKIILPRIKEVVRADEQVVYRPKKPHTKSSKGKRRAAPSSESEDDEVEPWETEPGRIVGDVVEWDLENDSSEIEEREDEIALSSAAIITRDVKDANFKFAKTLTLPFFGSGMVDLPPGGIKKPKNSRKMQMVFFVFYGRVEVSVNGNVFRIGKGGMWQVPRSKSPSSSLNNTGY